MSKQSNTDLILVFMILQIGLLAGCSSEQPEMPLSDTIGPSIELISPIAGSAVADTVVINSIITDDTAVGQVTIIVDGLPLTTLRTPPWRVNWVIDDLLHESEHTIQVEAVDTAGNLTLSDAISVTVLLNLAPVIEILWPPDHLWIDQDSPSAPWRCAAFDPDEGELGGSQITWSIDERVSLGQGFTINSPQLSDGLYHLSASATDRWGRRGSVTHTITLFHFTDEATPSSTLDSFLMALRTRDPERAGSSFDDAFELAQPGSQGACLSKTDLCGGLQALFADSLLSVFTIDARQTMPDEFTWRNQRFAKIELSGLGCRCTYRGSGALTDLDWSIRSSGARIFLVWDDLADNGGKWRLYRWWDLHQSYPLASEGPGWSDILRQLAIDSLP